jgi:ABC-type multidrug transport system ATPase subunit
MTPIVEAIDVVVGFHSRPVARAGSFRMPADRLTVVTGPNGSGKTTLLKTIAGLLAAISGRIVPRLPHGVGGAVFVHSSPYLFTGTVRSNVQLASGGDEQRVRNVLRALNLDALRNNDVGRLSSGERQRVAIARALATKPQLLLIDEPEGGLDSQGLRAWRAVVEQALVDGSPSIVIATHHLSGLDGLPVNAVPLA